MAFDRTSYQREYMRKRRAKQSEAEAQAVVDVHRMATALKEVMAALDGNEKPLAVKVREIASRGLA